MGVHTLVDKSEGSGKTSLIALLLGRPLATSEESEQRIGVPSGVAIFGLDALGSAAYGPEAALTILIPLGLAGLAYIFPITLCILALLTIVYFSYRQTLAAYPTGGGSYTVARENLGAHAGLLAGTALIIDYLLNVAVGISTGVGALVSAVPKLQPHTLELCLGILLILTLVNLRGMREAGLVFIAPTYLFVGCLAIAIAIGMFKTIAGGGHPHPVVAPPKLHPAIATVGVWLLIKTFASGCTAMTGVEAVSNGVQAFREPVVQTAQRTLTAIVAILIILLAGIAYLTSVYHIGATEPGRPGYESILSQLVRAAAGKGIFYYVTIGSILIVLALSANTSFAGFPRLCRVMAQDRYLPYGFTVRGRRLVYAYGVYTLAFLSGLLLVVFGGVTDRLIPLFAIGAFLSFTMSQAGMVAHWRKQEKRPRGSLAINAVGAAATGITTIVVAVAKFSEGAWITLLLIPAILGVMLSIERRYRRVAKEISNPAPLNLADLEKPLIVVPLDEWNKAAQKALRFAMTLSDQVQVLHIDSGDKSDTLKKDWKEWAEQPAQKASKKPPELVIVKSPYRYVVTPILDYVLDLEHRTAGPIAVVMSQLVEPHWYHFLLHNQRAKVLTALLTTQGNERISVINVPWYLEKS